jgi:hypothetical protein
MADINFPKFPTKRERGEAIGILKNEAAKLIAYSERWGKSADEYSRKLAGQRRRKAVRLQTVISWLEALNV